MFCLNELSRNEVASLFLESADAARLKGVTEANIGRVSPRGLTAIWTTDPREAFQVPNILLCNQTEMRDLIAWLWSYAADARPFTALTRLMDPSVLGATLALPAKPHFPGRSENAWLGLIFAEAMIVDEKTGGTGKLSLAQCAGTCSFVQARAKALGYGAESISSISLTWSKARAIVTRDVADAPTKAITDPWSYLHFVGSNRPRDLFQNVPPNGLRQPIPAALQEFESQGVIGESTWSALTRSRLLAADARSLSELTREERVRKIHSISSDIMNSSLKDETDAFLVAYLVSQVSPGSMEHMHLLRGSEGLNRPAVYWYGIFAGLAQPSALGSAFGVGRRLARELNRPASVMDRPSGDVDYIELLVASESTRDSAFGASYPGYVDVSLLPNVVTTISSGVLKDDRRDTSNQERLQTLEHTQRLERILSDARATVDLLNRSLGGEKLHSSYTRNTKRK